MSRSVNRFGGQWHILGSRKQVPGTVQVAKKQSPHTILSPQQSKSIKASLDWGCQLAELAFFLMSMVVWETPGFVRIHVAPPTTALQTLTCIAGGRENRKIAGGSYVIFSLAILLLYIRNIQTTRWAEAFCFGRSSPGGAKGSSQGSDVVPRSLVRV